MSLHIERRPLGPGALEVWTLNDPATRNALTDEVVKALLQACHRAQDDADLRGVVLQGAGGSFCAGGSLGGFANAIGHPLPAGQADPLVPMNRAFGDLLQALSQLRQWLLVAVDGAAMGGGLGLVCCADWVVCTARAVFATPEVTLGLVPAQITPFVLRRLGDARARHWLLSGQRFTAEQALAAGLVQQITHDDLAGAVDAAVRQWSQAAPQAVALTKGLLQAAEPMNLSPWLDAGAQAFAQALRGPEAPQGLRAFGARQPTPWSVA